MKKSLDLSSIVSDFLNAERGLAKKVDRPKS